MTRKQLQASLRNLRIAHSLPRTKKQIVAARESIKIASSVRGTEKQLKALAKARKIAQRSLRSMPKTWLRAENRTPKQRAADLRNIALANSLLKNRGQREASRKTIEYAREGLKKRRKEINGVCEICGIQCFTYGDHCHKTGKKRGRLCGKCNMGIGLFNDSPELLRRVADYLEKYKVKRFPRTKVA